MNMRIMSKASFSSRIRLLSSLIALLLVACSQENSAPETAQPRPQAQLSEAGEVPAYPQRDGDPVLGRKALLEEAYVTCGLPERVMRQLIADQSVVEVEGRHARADGLPFASNVFTNAEGLSIVSSNCLTCHGTVLFGELVLGLGNEFLDFTGDASLPIERAGALVRGEQEIAAWERLADRMAAIAPYIQTRTVGSNPANNLTFALIAHRDAKTNAWSEKPLLPLPPTEPPPVSVPPWWRMAKKNAMFNLGEGRGDHARLMMSASMLCSDSIAELEQIDRFAPDIRAFIASLEPPPWPFNIDKVLAAEGQEVFTANCSVCHGEYENPIRYPNRLVPIEVLDTDPTLVEFARGDGLAYIDWYNRSYYGRRSIIAPGPGYVAPPLDGIWATAPFLHNGSVPSIRLLLDSPRRPTLWRHEPSDASDPGSYDTANLGWNFNDLSADLDTTPATRDLRVFDTQAPGHANSGHRFGDHLSDTERTAIIEYLKTL